MTTSLRSCVFTLTIAASLLGAATAAHAQTPTVITSLPCVINTGGDYVLNSNLSSAQTSGYLIEIKASNVTLDFQNHYITGPANNTTQTVYGIRGTERSNVTVKNGTIAYCYQGIYLNGNSGATTNAVGALIDNMRITYCLRYGISVEYYLATRIANCQVSKTGYSGASAAFGIDSASYNAVVQNNVVSTVTATTGYGITSTGSFVRQNAISNCTVGISGGKYQDNLTLNCTTPFANGTDAGGNN